jgi:inosine-uridine nucleoside N-ribohydrolase
MDGSPQTEDQGLPRLDTGKLIIDTDAGVDDAVALFLALGYEAKQLNSSIRIMAITCVFGNTAVNNVAQNVLKVLKTANRMDVCRIWGPHSGAYEWCRLLGYSVV